MEIWILLVLLLIGVIGIIGSLITRFKKKNNQIIHLGSRIDERERRL